MEKMEVNEEATTAAAATAAAPPTFPPITIHIKFGGRTISVSLSPESTGKDLKSRLQPLTNVLPRGQKLIFKGKLLADSMSLKSLQITDGSKIMLIASQGLHQGDGPVTEDATSAAPNLRKNSFSHQNQAHNTTMPIGRPRSEYWKLTGVVALTERLLKAVPDEVWDCGPSIRVLDISNNLIQELPAKVGFLKSLNKLYLNANDLSDEMVSWDGLSQLKALRILSFNQNKFTTLPPAVGGLISLTQLHVAKNKLTCLPDELGRLNQLQILKADCNRISSLPASIGNCSSLIEIDLSSNLLAEVPETFGKLQNLKALHLSNNGLKTLPSTLFKMCSQLSILDLHRTEITNDILRQIVGWEDFDERRRLKHQKQLDFHVGSSGAFDEGIVDVRKLGSVPFETSYHTAATIWIHLLRLGISSRFRIAPSQSHTRVSYKYFTWVRLSFGPLLKHDARRYERNVRSLGASRGYTTHRTSRPIKDNSSRGTSICDHIRVEGTTSRSRARARVMGDSRTRGASAEKQVRVESITSRGASVEEQVRAEGTTSCSRVRAKDLISSHTEASSPTHRRRCGQPVESIRASVDRPLSPPLQRPTTLDEMPESGDF